ncbi:hypothetical protein ACOSQ2_014533 [Xanthoceras sorbifolium]
MRLRVDRPTASTIVRASFQDLTCRGVGGKTVKAHGNAGRKQESDGKKETGDGKSSNTKTQKKGSRFNVLEEQPDEVMEIETIECPEEKVNSSALKDVTILLEREPERVRVLLEALVLAEEGK